MWFGRQLKDELLGGTWGKVHLELTTSQTSIGPAKMLSQNPSALPSCSTTNRDHGSLVLLALTHTNHPPPGESRFQLNLGLLTVSPPPPIPIFPFKGLCPSAPGLLPMCDICVGKRGRSFISISIKTTSPVGPPVKQLSAAVSAVAMCFAFCECERGSYRPVESTAPK